jgi:transmembrane sensor
VTLHQTTNPIDSEAADWVARLDANPEARTDFDAWLASDPRCFGAYARARALYLSPQLETALGGRRLPLVDTVSRRGFLAAMAASLVAGCVWLIPRSKPAVVHRFESVLGEIRTIPLEDGSRITLNTNSALTVEYRKAARLIHLTRGEAFFEVAKAEDRPFIVMGPMVQVRTVGTSYSVRLVKRGTMQVQVATGRVALEAPPSKLSQSVMRMADVWPGFRPDEKSGVFVDADQSAMIRLVDPSAESGEVLINISAVASDTLQQALMWRQGQLSFTGDSLAEASSQFARYSRQKIVVKGAKLAQERISGLFSATDPHGFAQAAAVSLGASIKINGDTIILYK